MSALRKNILLAIDPSLRASGWAAFCLRSAKPICVGVVSAPGPAELLSKRLDALQSKLEQLFDSLEMAKGDILVCEGPAPLVLNPLSALKVERVRSMFETIARTRKVDVPGRLNPRTVQTELLGLRGAQLPRKKVKLIARQVAERLYGDNLSKLFLNNGHVSSKRQLPQDVVDAVLVGVSVLARIQVACSTGMKLNELFVPKNSKNMAENKCSSLGWSDAEIGRMLKSRRLE
ncbi:MAG: hypothetical protein IT291_09985 [Deltaproteobacteria bacterium]|nr:hypothetical protein [Deltaproteobacteria bacterium]